MYFFSPSSSFFLFFLFTHKENIRVMHLTALRRFAERENIFNVGMEGVAGGVQDGEPGGGGGGLVATVYIYVRTVKLNKLSCASDYAVSPFREVFNVLKTLYIANR